VKITVVSEQGKEAVVAILGTNEFFGEGCLAAQVQRIATVRTMTESIIMRLEKSAIIRVIHVALSAHRALHAEGYELFLEVAAGVLAASI
jgi:CRP-like cAMP-binding protein